MPASSKTILLLTGGFKRSQCSSIHRAKWNGRRKLAVDIASSCSLQVPADGAPQEVLAEGRESGALGIVLAITVTASGGLVKVGLIAHCLQLCRHLASMAGMHAVVAPAGCDQDWRVLPARHGVVIGGDFLKKLPVHGISGVAIFGYPARAGVQFCIAAHVDQRDRAEERTKPLRITGQHVGDQNPTVRPAFGSDPAGPCYPAAHQIDGDGGEIIVAEPFLLATEGIVPGGAELA